jgi:hypothetical protein
MSQEQEKPKRTLEERVTALEAAFSSTAELWRAITTSNVRTRQDLHELASLLAVLATILQDEFPQLVKRFGSPQSLQELKDSLAKNNGKN